MTRQLSFDDDDDDDDDAGEFFRKETLGQWRKKRWRKPDVFDTYPDGARAIWYGPNGADGDEATECIWDTPSQTFEVTEYQSIAGDFDEGTYDPDEPFSTQTTSFTIKAVMQAIKDIGENPTGIIMWAVSLGVAQLAYFGGAESMVDSLPTGSEEWNEDTLLYGKSFLKGLSGDVVQASRRFIDSSIPPDVEVLKDGSWILSNAFDAPRESYVRIVEGSDHMWRVRDKRDRLWTSGLTREWNTPRAAYNAYKGR
jgi:hypothetical protein